MILGGVTGELKAEDKPFGRWYVHISPAALTWLIPFFLNGVTCKVITSF